MRDIHPDPEILKTATNYAELKDIALGQLEKFKNETILQVCGPMTTGGLGSFEENMKLFNKAIQILEDKGHTVFNQTAYNNDMLRIYSQEQRQGYPMELLLQFYEPVFKSGFIKELHFLPKWETSKGSRWERKTGEQLPHITIVDFDQTWF